MDIAQADIPNRRIKMIWSTTESIFVTDAANFRWNTAVTTGWIHIVMVYDGTAVGNSNRLKGYEAGLPQAGVYAGTIPAFISAIVDDLNLGLDAQSSNYTTGNLDEVSIWNGTALSDAEVLELNDGGKPANLENHSQYATLSNWWRMGDDPLDDATGGSGTIRDQKGTDHGTPINTDAGDIVANVP